MIRLQTYSLPLRTPFRAAGREWTERSGLLLEWIEGENGWVAEAAPLPGRSAERLEEVIRIARDRHCQLPDWILDKGSIPDGLPSSLLFALSALRLQVFESRTAVTDHTDDPAGDLRDEGSLQVNGVIGLCPPDELNASILSALQAGYTTIKVKLGSEPQPLIRTLRNLAGSHPAMRLRIDANRSWEWDDAKRWLDALTDLPVDYCEEPLAHPAMKDLEELQRGTSVPIALDESLSTLHDLHTAAQHPLLDTYVLKATLLGDLEQISRTLRIIPHPVRTIWTTTLESAVARTTLRRAAREWGAAGRAHGLDTGSLFEYDLVDPNAMPAIDDGPERPGVLNRHWALPSRLLDRTRIREVD